MNEPYQRRNDSSAAPWLIGAGAVAGAFFGRRHIASAAKRMMGRGAQTIRANQPISAPKAQSSNVRANKPVTRTAPKMEQASPTAVRKERKARTRYSDLTREEKKRVMQLDNVLSKAEEQGFDTSKMYDTPGGNDTNGGFYTIRVDDGVEGLSKDHMHGYRQQIVNSIDRHLASIEEKGHFRVDDVATLTSRRADLDYVNQLIDRL